MKPQTTADAWAPPLATGTLLEDLDEAGSDGDVRLESCTELDWIVVRTRQSVYEMIVLSGDSGEVVVRGGELFPEFHRATIAGSILGDSALKVRTICVGLRLEIHVNGQRFVTSRVQAVSRCRIPVAEGRA